MCSALEMHQCSGREGREDAVLAWLVEELLSTGHEAKEVGDRSKVNI